MTDEPLIPAAGPPVDSSPAPAEVPERPNRYATAGRLGAERVHELIRLGQLYERDHGLSRGRQRLRQLIQLGKRYEQEHGLAEPAPRRRRSREDVWQDFLRALADVVKPAYRAEVERLAAALAGRPAPAADDPPLSAAA